MQDIVVKNLEGNDSIAASCGRDRTIQIFRVSRDECLLQQSLVNEHAGPIRKLELANNATILVSMSSDRTIIIHSKVLRSDESIAFVSTKIITLKASPTAMSLLPAVKQSILVSAMDRCVRRISLAQGDTTHTFKTSDQPHGESVVLSRLSVGNSSQGLASEVLLAGFSSADGSIRLYTVETGLLIAVVQGQTAVSDLALTEASEDPSDTGTRIVSTAFDGTVTVWKLVTTSQHLDTNHEPGDASSSKLQLPSTLRPLRRVLSKSEIAEFQRSLKGQEGDKIISSRTMSPSRVRRKPSRYAIPDAFRAPEKPSDSRSSHSSAGSDTQQIRSKHASPPLSPRVNLQSRARRSSLDERNRNKAADSTYSLDLQAKQISDTLREFRKHMATSKESLGSERMQALQTELHATSATLLQRTGQKEPASDGTGSELFDDYLAKLIDDRLALRLRSRNQTNTTEGSRDTDPSTRSTTDPVVRKA